MDITVRSSKTFKAPIGAVWSVEVDPKVAPAGYRLVESSDDTLERVGSTATFRGAWWTFAGACATVTMSVPRERNVVSVRVTRARWTMAWCISPDVAVDVHMERAAGGRTRVVASTTLRLRIWLSALLIFALVAYLGAGAWRVGNEPGGVPLTWADLAIGTVLWTLTFWTPVGLLAPAVTAKLNSTASLWRIRKGLRTSRSSADAVAMEGGQSGALRQSDTKHKPVPPDAASAG